jgi:hypothetical protein
MKFFTQIAATILFALMIIAFTPGSVLAQTKTISGLIPCGNVVENGMVVESERCTFDDLIVLAQIVINFLIFKIAAPLAAVMFAYAGFLWLTNAGNESKITQAREVFWMVFWGLVIALAAWLTVNMIVTFFVGEGSAVNYLESAP